MITPVSSGKRLILEVYSYLRKEIFGYPVIVELPRVAYQLFEVRKEAIISLPNHEGRDEDIRADEETLSLHVSDFMLLREKMHKKFIAGHYTIGDKEETF